MNKVLLLGRLTKDPETRYTQGSEPMAIARYTLAVNRRFKKEGEADADFISCVAFGKNGEFAQRYLQKGRQIAICARLQTRSYEDKEGRKKYSTDVVVEEQYFADKKADNGAEKKQDFYPIDESAEEDLPF